MMLDGAVDGAVRRVIRERIDALLLPPLCPCIAVIRLYRGL
jgi:hypothetical protein